MSGINVRGSLSRGFWLVGCVMLSLSSCASTTPTRTFEQRTVGLYVQGTDLYKKGDYIQAIYLLRQATTFNAKFAEAYYVLGLTYIKTEQHEDSIKMLRQAAELAPITETPGYDDADIEYNIGLARMGLDDLDAAKENLNKAVTLREDYAKAYHNLAYLEQKLGDKAAAYNHLKKAIESDSTMDEAQVALGSLYANDGQLDDAKAHFERATKINKDNKSAFNELGKVYSQKKDYATGIRYFRRAIQIDGQFIEAYYNMAVAHVELQEPDKAVAVMGKASLADSTRPEVFVYSGDILAIAEKYKLALEAYDKALRLKPDVQLVNFKIAQILEKQARDSDAIAAYRREIEIQPEHADSYFNSALLLHKSKQFDEALADYRKFIELVPEGDERAKRVRKILDELEKLN